MKQTNSPGRSQVGIWDAWKDVLEVEFLHKKIHNTPLIIKEDDETWNFILESIPDRDRFAFNIPHATDRYQSYSRSKHQLSGARFLIENDKDFKSIISDLIRICEGHLFLCGGAILSILKKSNVNDYDMFFVCDTQEQADHYLRICLEFIDKYLRDNKIRQFSFITNLHVITVGVNHFKIQFIKRLYKSPGQILEGFDLHGCRYGFGLNGFFTTPGGAFAYLSTSFPIDTNQITTSHSSRIEKYINMKHFTVLLPGRRPRDGADEFKTCDLKFCSTEDDPLKYHLQYSGGRMESDYEPPSDHPLSVKTKEVLKSTQKDDLDNCFLKTIKNNPQLARLYSPSAVDIMVLDDRTIEETITHRMSTDAFEHGKFNKRYAKKIMGHLYREWAVAYVLDDPIQKELWEKRRKEFFEAYKVVCDHILNNRWKTMNPGDQFFGKLNPLKVTPAEWYGEDYIPVVVGMNVERQLPFLRALPEGYPQDLIRLIMIEWAQHEMELSLSSLVKKLNQ